MNTPETFNSFESSEVQDQLPNLHQMGVETFLSLPVEERCNLAATCLSHLYDAIYDGRGEDEVKRGKESLMDKHQIKALWERRDELSRKDFDTLIEMLNPGPGASYYWDQETRNKVDELSNDWANETVKKRIEKLEKRGNASEHEIMMTSLSTRSMQTLPGFSQSVWLEIPPSQGDVCPFSGLPADTKLTGGYGSFDENAIPMHHSVAKDFVNFAHKIGRGIDGITIVKHKPNSQQEILFGHPSCVCSYPESYAKEWKEGFTNNIGALDGRTNYFESDLGGSHSIEDDKTKAELTRKKVEEILFKQEKKDTFYTNINSVDDFGTVKKMEADHPDIDFTKEIEDALFTRLNPSDLFSVEEALKIQKTWPNIDLSDVIRKGYEVCKKEDESAHFCEEIQKTWPDVDFEEGRSTE